MTGTATIATTPIAAPEPCLYCGRATFRVGEEGPFHPCCKIWIGQWGHKTCPACARFNSQEANRRAERKKKVGTTVTREDHRQRLLGRLKAAGGLWVGDRTLSQNASPEVAALVSELIGYGQRIESRENPMDPTERQYRLGG